MLQIADGRCGILGTLRARFAPMSSKAQELQRRLVSFSAQVIQISGKLPKTVQASHIGKQLLRSGTAAAANYGEARGAESRSDFVHKLRVVLKELNETAIWLDLVIASSFLPKEKIAGNCRGKYGIVPDHR